MTKSKTLLIIIIAAITIGVILGLQSTLLKYKNQFFGQKQVVPQANGNTGAKGAPSIKDATKDKNGCLLELQYFYDEELGLCVRLTDIPSADKTAIKTAVNYTGKEFGLRLRKYINAPCDTCYKVKMAVDERYFTVRVKSGRVVDSYDEEPMGAGSPIGTYTTTSELMYNVATKILGMPAIGGLEQLDVTWNDGTQEQTFSGIGQSVEDNFGSERITDLYNVLVDLFTKDLGFSTDENNLTTSTQDYSFRVLSDRDNVCNILLERNPILDNSHLQVACAEF